MIPIDDVVRDIWRSAKRLISEGKPLPSILSDHGRILSILMEGEKRRLRSQRLYATPIPRTCIFSVTWKCNLNCIGCYAKRYGSPGRLDLDDIQRIGREAAHLGSYVFIIAGGEPLMVPGLIPALREIKDGFFFLFTNGTLLKGDHVLELKRAKNVFPVLSVEGPPEMTAFRRGEGVDKKVGDAMNALAEAGVAFGFSSMVTHRNLQAVLSREWLDTIWESGGRFGFMIDYIPFPHDRSEELVLTREDILFKTLRLNELHRDARPLLLNFPPDEYKDSGCQAAGTGFVHLNADGFVEPCPFSHYASDNLMDRSLLEALRSDFLRALRRGVAQMQNPLGECLLFRESEWVESVAAKTGAFCTETVMSLEEARHATFELV